MNNHTTSKTQHTPGPWTSGEQGNGHIVWQPDHGTIATIGGDMVGAQANARLIAAAPDLLELARQIVLESESLCNAEMPDDILAGARAAIAKAEGK